MSKRAFFLALGVATGNVLAVPLGLRASYEEGVKVGVIAAVIVALVLVVLERRNRRRTEG